MKKNEPEIILSIVTGLSVIYLFLQFKVLLFLSVFIGLAGLFSVNLRSKISGLWMSFARILGFVNSRVLLTIVFFFILTPLAVLRKIFDKDVLALKNNKASFYIERGHEFKAQDMENMW